MFSLLILPRVIYIYYYITLDITENAAPCTLCEKAEMRALWWSCVENSGEADVSLWYLGNISSDEVILNNFPCEYRDVSEWEKQRGRASV